MSFLERLNSVTTLDVALIVVPFHVEDPRTFELGGCDLLGEGQGPIVEGTRPLVPDPVEFDLLETGERIRDDRVVLVIVGVIQILEL